MTPQQQSVVDAARRAGYQIVQGPLTLRDEVIMMDDDLQIIRIKKTGWTDAASWRPVVLFNEILYDQEW